MSTISDEGRGETDMSKNPKYSELVAQAEKAVAGVNDPELKRIAFQKVLDDLIGGRSGAVNASASTKSKRNVRSSKVAGAAKGGPQVYVKELSDEDFFKKPKTIANVKAELENRGHHIPITSLSGPLQKLCQRKVLRRQRVKVSGNKATFAYSNW